MIVAIALCDFSEEIMKQSSQQQNQTTETKPSILDKESETIQKAINFNEGGDQSNGGNDDIKENNNNEQNNEECNEGQEQDSSNISPKKDDLDEKNNKETNLDPIVKNDNISIDQGQETVITQSDQAQGMQYLSFKKDDRIVVKYQNENGWWWGCQLGIRNPVDGYFPSTYVKVSHKIGDDLDEREMRFKEEDIEKMGWQEYAQFVKNQAQQEDIDKQYDKFVNDTCDRKDNNLDMFLNPGIKGYKKVKIDPSSQDSYKNIQGSFFSKEGDTVFIPIKSQDPLDKAHRQLNHYFDYDAWNEQMNRSKQRKANPNPNKKKEKNDNKFLSKLK